MHFNLLLVFWLISIASAKPTSSKAKKPKRIGFLTALAITSKIGPELALNYGPTAYKALKKRYVSGKAHLKIMGEDGKMRDAKKGEAVKVDLSHPETYAVIEKSKKDPKQKEAIVAHPNLLSYDPPDPNDIHVTSQVVVEHDGYQWGTNRYGYTASSYNHQQTQQQYSDNPFSQDYTGSSYSQPYQESSQPYQGSSQPYTGSSQPYTGDPNQQQYDKVPYTTYEQPSTITSLPEHTPHNPEQGPPKNEIPRTQAIKEITLWPGFMEQLSDGSWMEAYHIAYAFSQDYPFTPQDQKLIRNVMDKFAQMTCVRFTPTWYEGQHHVIIENKPGEGCCSYAGIEKYYGNQTFNLETPGCMHEGVIAHELGHVAGLHHTQQRADRNKYVNVYWDYISDKYKSDFTLYTNYQPQVPYDKQSIMHYMSNHGNAWPQYSSVTDSNNQPIVHERKVQLGDYHWINTAYQCTWYMQYTKSYFDNWTTAS
ncbi:astacin (Peptidase family m12A) domain-containing protein [Ditylenchus destructor]|nr:astacin (Peptidase family m12A) domain-containing protein [Ditylenchus destructor]